MNYRMMEKILYCYEENVQILRTLLNEYVQKQEHGDISVRRYGDYYPMSGYGFADPIFEHVEEIMILEKKIQEKIRDVNTVDAVIEKIFALDGEMGTKMRAVLTGIYFKEDAEGIGRMTVKEVNMIRLKIVIICWGIWKESANML